MQLAPRGDFVEVTFQLLSTCWRNSWWWSEARKFDHVQQERLWHEGCTQRLLEGASWCSFELWIEGSSVGDIGLLPTWRSWPCRRTCWQSRGWFALEWHSGDGPGYGKGAKEVQFPLDQLRGVQVLWSHHWTVWQVFWTVSRRSMWSHKGGRPELNQPHRLRLASCGLWLEVWAGWAEFAGLTLDLVSINCKQFSRRPRWMTFWLRTVCWAMPWRPRTRASSMQQVLWTLTPASYSQRRQPCSKCPGHQRQHCGWTSLPVREDLGFGVWEVSGEGRRAYSHAPVEFFSFEESLPQHFAGGDFELTTPMQQTTWRFCGALTAGHWVTTLWCPEFPRYRIRDWRLTSPAFGKNFGEDPAHW